MVHANDIPESREKTKQQESLIPGERVWLACEVTGDDFLNALMVRVVPPATVKTWTGFIQKTMLAEDKGRMFARALVLEVSKDGRVYVQPFGEPIDDTVVEIQAGGDLCYPDRTFSNVSKPT